MSASCTITCRTEADTAALGAELSRLVLSTIVVGVPEGQGAAASVGLPFRIHLSGPLGAGKSSLCRAFLRALGVQGAIKSPSYALMEVYNLLNCLVYHFDLYRLSSPVELLEYGLLELMVANSNFGVVCLVEWPEQAQGVLPKPDLHLQLAFVPAVPAVPAVQALGTENQARSLALSCMQERALVLQSFGARGQAVLAGCQAWSQVNL